MDNLGDLIIDASHLLLFINTILYLKALPKRGKAFKLICTFLLLTLFIQIGSVKIYKYFHNTNLFFSHYFFIGQFIVLSYFFKSTLKSKLVKRLIPSILVLILLILAFQYYNNPKLYYKFNELEVLITSIPLMLYSLLFLFQNIEIKSKKFIYFNAGFFVYTLCSTLIFFSGNFKASKETLLILWKLHSVLYLAFQILIFIEWYINFRKTKTNSILDKVA